MYQFSKEAKEKLLKNQYMAFLFVYFTFLPDFHPEPIDAQQKVRQETQESAAAKAAAISEL